MLLRNDISFFLLSTGVRANAHPDHKRRKCMPFLFECQFYLWAEAINMKSSASHPHPSLTAVGGVFPAPGDKSDNYTN